MGWGESCFTLGLAGAETGGRAERRAGELLAGMNLQGGDRKSNSHDVTLKLSDLGIERMQPNRWQTQAIAKGFDTSDDEADAFLKVPTSRSEYPHSSCSILLQYLKVLLHIFCV